MQCLEQRAGIQDSQGLFIFSSAFVQDQEKQLHCFLSQLTHLQAWDHSLLLATIWQLEK